MPTAPETKSYKCRHIRISGRRCGDPALRDENFCFFHANNRRPPKHLGVDPDFAVFAFPPLEDHASILHALTDTLARVAAKSIDPRRAALLLTGLRIASTVLRHAARTPADPHAHPKTHTSLFVDTPANPSPEPQDDTILEDIVHDPTHGPLAPIAEYGVPDPNTSTSILDRVVEELRLQRLAGFIDRYPNGEPISPEDRLIPANWPRHHPIHNPQPNPTAAPTPAEIVILTLSEAEGEGPASPTPQETLTLTACEEPAPPKARVPHSSQLHRDGWDVIRPPATPSPYPTTHPLVDHPLETLHPAGRVEFPCATGTKVAIRVRENAFPNGSDNLQPATAILANNAVLPRTARIQLK